jgi:hypothetical protein
MTKQLSILIPALKNRPWEKLYNKIKTQIINNDVEILVELDNYEQKSGVKRQRLLDNSCGRYIIYIDDDDDISDNYVQSIIDKCDENPDVISIELEMLWLNKRYKREVWKFGMHPNRRMRGLMCINHLCAWKRDIAKKVAWCPDLGYGDVRLWFEPLYYANIVKKHTHIDQILYTYLYSDQITANQTLQSKKFSRKYFSNGIKCYKDSTENIFIGTPNDIDKSMARVRDCNNNVIKIDRIDLVHYHTIKIR